MSKLFAKNSKALYDYDIKDTFDAGLVLEGREVKSVKEGNVSLQGSYISLKDGKASLVGAHVGQYRYAINTTYNPTRTRLLLLTKSELHKLANLEKVLTIVPLEIFLGKRNLVKIKIGVARGRKKADKREYIKKRDTEKEIRKVL